MPLEEVLVKAAENPGHGALSIWPGAIQLPQAAVGSAGNHGYCHLGVAEM